MLVAPHGVHKRIASAGLLIAVLICVVEPSHGAPAVDEPVTAGGPATFRRLSEDQYRQSIEDIFGTGIKIPGRFEPPLRDEGLLSIGDSVAVITPSGIEQYELRAREISAQVLAGDPKTTTLGCELGSPKTFDEPCARNYLAKYGRLLFRRPLVDDEVASVVNVARAATQQTGDFYKGLQFGLSRLLISPNFLFRVETAAADPASTAALRLDDYALATRLSFLLWDAPPDENLLNAAASGELRRKEGLNAQVDRLIDSPRFARGVRAFFYDMFAYDEFDGLTKDQSIFPKYTLQLSKDAEEQALRTVVDLLVTNNGDYRNLFTTKKTFLNRTLGSLYKLPVHEAAFGGWMPYTFSSSDPHAGILTLAAFLMLDPTHEGRSSPTIRGKTVRELLLCQKIPPPPGNVDFKLVQDTHNLLYRTARDRLTAHRDNPVCAGCHSITDPIGLAMENYDAIGQYRTQENDAVIDASGSFEHKPYKDVIALEKILHDSPVATNCVAKRAYEYGVGRPVVPAEREWIGYLTERFAAEQYKFSALMRTVATSKAFQAVSSDTLASN
jgi:hypothetical protein